MGHDRKAEPERERSQKPGGWLAEPAGLDQVEPAFARRKSIQLAEDWPIHLDELC